ncbi:MAG: cupredoxin domain-containing protein [Nitrososphaerota archaeon]
MRAKFTFSVLLLILGGLTLTLSFQLSTSQTTEEENANEVISEATGNNTIILDAAEIDEEQYRWINNIGEENPALNMTLNTAYTIKIDNPTDEEHELIITSDADGKINEIAKGPEIEPGEDDEFEFTANQIGELGYHCEYHPDQMNGTITVTDFSS